MAAGNGGRLCFALVKAKASRLLHEPARESEADREQRLVVPVRDGLAAHVEHERWIRGAGHEPDRHPAADPALTVRREARGIDEAAATADCAAEIEPVGDRVLLREPEQRGAEANVDAAAEVLLLAVEDHALVVVARRG